MMVHKLLNLLINTSFGVKPMKTRQYLATYEGQCGIKYYVFKTVSGTYGWCSDRNEGFTNESYAYILEYLQETKGVNIK